MTDEQRGPSSPMWPPAEVIAWRGSMEDKLVSLRDMLNVRIDAVEKAAEVFSQNLNRVPTLLDREAARLQAILEERTGNIRTSISERDSQAKQDKISAAMAVQTALGSLKELISAQNGATAAAIAKSEAATANDLESLNKIIGTTKDGLSAEINNLKQRLDRGEGASSGQKELRREDHTTVISVVGITGGIVGIIALIIAGLAYVAPHPVPPFNPNIGADTKRVDDLITSTSERDRAIEARIDALSARLNTLQSPARTPPAPPN